jgi:homoserine dehydrogenase
VPLLEAIDGRSDVVAIRGVLNGTCNFVLDRLAAGASYHEALAEAQALGFAEPDPSSDVSGLDAEFKLRLCARAAFGRVPAAVARLGIDALDAVGTGAPGQVLRLIAEVRRQHGELRAQVAPCWLPEEDFLAGARGEENRVEVGFADGSSLRLSGKGAGRWPTTASVMGDLWEAARAAEAAAACAAPARQAALA